ncbi:MAG: EscJ/YscJ/HrcJ family type III secretion inner membrane ring protein [Gammaproteobacteria bacterium]|nr:MAG: EscJ/YscJ/HrcJ family type III secretion inner membrane ring protein [Pseudomonadota bacterium]PIE38886.1 MAG: EscJ/YscJ/HrcJ family type III secretion inner membrane ring protein [Gammaproteobacteria bacterium]
MITIWLRFQQLLKTAVLFMAVLALSACNESPLYSSLDEQQANEIEAALLAANINARKQKAGKDNGWSVSVDRHDIAPAMLLLSEKGLPKENPPTLHDVFPREGFVSSPREEKARYIYALSQELASTIMLIDGVVAARVHVALPEKQLLDDSPAPASASVVIIQEPGVDLSGYDTDIKAIVTDGIEDMKDVNRVTVKFFSKRKASLPENFAAPETNTPPAWLAGIIGITAGAGAAGIGGYRYRGKRRDRHVG